MKLIVIKDNLKEAIGAASQIKAGEQNLPILKNFLLSVEEGKIFLRATNLELGVEYEIPGKVIEEGSATMPIGVFYTIINSLQSDRINIETKDTQTIIKTDNYEATLQGLPVDDFPILPTIQESNSFLEIKGEILKDAFQEVSIASQMSDLRPELYNILFHFSVSDLILAGTDSFRLAEKTIPLNLFTTTFEEEFKALIPLPTIQELIPLLGEESVKIYRDDHQILFTTKNWNIVSRLHTGTFPHYEPIIPKDFKSEITLHKGEFQEALKLSSVFSGQLQEVVLKVEEDKKFLQVLSQNQTIGQNTYRLGIKTSKPVSFEVVFNARYIGEVLKIIGGDEVSIGFTEETKPILIKSPKDATYIYILMPVLKG